MKRPLLWILGVWIMGEIAAHVIGISLVPVTKLDRVMADRDSAIVQVTGTVRQFRHTSPGYAYLLSDNLVSLGGETYDVSSSQILVYSDDISELTIGNVVSVTGELSLFDVPSNPGQFDLHAYYLAQGIGWCLDESRVTVENARIFPAEQFLWTLRESLRAALLAVSSEEEAGVFLSVFLGDRSMMDSEVRDLYQTGGISHVLAISGLHISLFGMALHEFLRKIGCPVPLNLALSGGILTAYVLMTGCSASATRALIMFLVFLLAKAVGRTYDLLSALSLAGILLLAEHPLLLWEGSFQLSFLAMIAVGYVWPLWEKTFSKLEKERKAEKNKWVTDGEAAAAKRKSTAYGVKTENNECRNTANSRKVGNVECRHMINNSIVGCKDNKYKSNSINVGEIDCKNAINGREVGIKDCKNTLYGGKVGKNKQKITEYNSLFTATRDIMRKVGRTEEILCDITREVGDNIQIIAVLWHKVENNALINSGACGIVGNKGENAENRMNRGAVSDGLRWLSGIWGGFRRGICFSLAIQLMTAPVLAWHYSAISVCGLFLNLLVLPFAGVLLGFAAAAAAVGILGMGAAERLSGIMILPARAVLLWYDRLCRLAEKVPFHSMVTGRPRGWQILLYYLILGLGLLWMTWYVRQEESAGKICADTNDEREANRNKSCSSKRIGRGCFLFWILLLVFTIQQLPCFSLQITVIDVGQGDSIFLRCPGGRCCLIDGGSTSVTDVGTWRILPYLKNQGVDHLDAIFVTHGDADHMNGLAEVLSGSQISVGALCLTESSMEDTDMEELRTAAENTGIPVRVVHQGEEWTWGEVNFQCLYPSETAAADWENDKNNSSMVIRIEYGDFSALFTGDLAEEGEKELLQSGLVEKTNLLKVGHHGSKYSSSEEFLEALDPDIAVISCGENNRYGHPHAETLNRLAEVVKDAEIVKTMESGAVTVRVYGKSVKLDTYLP